MAMICVSGCRECDGCGRCEKESEVIGYCAHCDEPIYEGEDYYDIEGDVILHEDCLTDWARQYLKKY